MRHSTVFLTLLLIVGLAAMVFVSSATAQAETPTTDYARLTTNVPEVKALEAKGIPILTPETDLRPGLNLVGQESPIRAMAVIEDYTSPFALHVLMSDGDEGEIQVYQYDPDSQGYLNLDCSGWPFDTETENIFESGILSSPLTIREFLHKQGCENDMQDSPVPLMNATITQALLDSASVIKTTFQGNMLASTSAPTKTDAAAATTPPIIPTPTTCTEGTVVAKYALQNGTYGNLGTAPHRPPLTITPDDIRLPASIIFYDKVGTTERYRYLLTINQYAASDGVATLQAVLCVNENGQWRNSWPTMNFYATNEEHTRYQLASAETPVSTPITTKWNAWNNRPELSIQYYGGEQSKVKTYYYLHDDTFNLDHVALDAQQATNDTVLRFALDSASVANLQKKVPELKDLTANALQGQLSVTVQSTNNTGPKSFTAQSVTPGEGLLNFNGINDGYWKITDPQAPAEYTFTFKLKDYREIRKKITLYPKDLSPTGPDGLSSTDIVRFTIEESEIQKDCATICNNLYSCLACVDTSIASRYVSEAK